MSDFFTVKGDIKEITRDLSKVQRKIVPAATVSALNRTAGTIRTASTREISTTKRITPQKIIRNRLSLVRATRRFLGAMIFAKLHRVGVGKLGIPKQTKKGSKIKGRFYEGAFVAKMPTGYTSIWERTTKKRFPIKEKTIELQPEADIIIRKHIRTTGADAFVKNFTSELKWRLNRRRV